MLGIFSVSFGHVVNMGARAHAGETDVSEHFSLSMEVFPSVLNHNGILFSVGSRPNFEYYEWKTAAVNTQFIVVEFIFSAVRSRSVRRVTSISETGAALIFP